MREEGKERSWQRTVLLGLAALASSAMIIGAVVGVMAIGVANVVGVGEDTGTDPAPNTASLYLPPYTKTPRADQPETEEAPRRRVTAVPLDPTDGPTSEVGEMTLFASPGTVSNGERINLSGSYLDGDGVALQVQRREGDAWVDFPTTANVRGGSFETYVYTGRAGENVFRMFDPTTGRSSNAVTVQVG